MRPYVCVHVQYLPIVQRCSSVPEYSGEFSLLYSDIRPFQDQCNGP